MIANKKIKITFIGDTAVGKTSIIERFLVGKFNEFQEATIGASFSCQNININNGRIMMEIWDTAGQERFRSLVPMYYRNADVIVLVYSLADIISFENLEFWIGELKKNMIDDSYTIFVVGNKCDLNKNFDSMLIEDFIRYKLKKSIKIIHIQTSSKDGKNINLLFNLLGNCKSKQNNRLNRQEIIEISKEKANYNDDELCLC